MVLGGGLDIPAWVAHNEDMPRTVTYAERADAIEPIAAELERIAYRLRQGAISTESAVAKLASLKIALQEIDL